MLDLNWLGRYRARGLLGAGLRKRVAGQSLSALEQQAVALADARDRAGWWLFERKLGTPESIAEMWAEGQESPEARIARLRRRKADPTDRPSEGCEAPEQAFDGVQRTDPLAWVDLELDEVLGPR